MYRLDDELTTPVERGIATVAQALGDEGRVRILVALLDGRALPATRLAMEAGVAPSTASVHLRKLLDTGLLKEVPSPVNRGRYRFYAIAGEEVAALCERFLALIPHAPVRSLQAGTRDAAMRSARTCYDHLAGRLAIRLMDAMLTQGMIASHDGSFAIGATGEARFARFGIDLGELRARKRPLIRHCLDWSERCPHLSGGLGAALLQQIEERGWIERSLTDRSATITTAGKLGFQTWFDLNVDDLDMGHADHLRDLANDDAVREVIP
ncbi:MAG TPA: ArsR family transcriptional regulator [Thermomicrobiales bacterium]|nr:ArsR family transcriptional regulator [Thermomicrobiales bacterium]